MSATSPRVRFLPSGARVAVPTGSYLTAAAIRADVSIVHDCDGQGVCGTCRVRVEAGPTGLSPVDPRERQQLGDAIDDGWRLCCLPRVVGDVTVLVPGGVAYPPARQPER